MGISFWQILIVVGLLVLLFGRGKISDLMGDVAKGITSFKKGLKEADQEPAEAAVEDEAEPKAIADKRTARSATVKAGDSAKS